MTIVPSLHCSHLKGNTQAFPDSGPELVVQEGTVMASSVQPEVAETEQSPQLQIVINYQSLFILGSIRS